MLLPTAFVVEIDAAKPAQLRGRIEHVLSGECGHFDSAVTLLEFIRRALAASDQADAPTMGGKGSVR